MSNSEESIIRLRRVGKSFGEGPTVLDGIDLDVAEGEFVSFIGPSGCGKSTLLRLIAGLRPLTSGRITVDGNPPEKMRREMAFIFQEPALLPWRTVLGNIEIPLQLQGVRRRERRRVAERMIELVGLQDVRRYYPRQLSGGMKMRVSLARSLTKSPRIIILDEPFGALDAITRDRLNEDLLTIRTEKEWTALYVTHSVPEAVYLSSRVVVLCGCPGHVHLEIPVPFPYPRPAELRESAEYLAVVGSVSDALHDASRSMMNGPRPPCCREVGHG
jgi:NitT/TauT family transport system ATP-binding protein